MMDRNRLLLRIGAIAGDIVLINIAFLIAYWMRYVVEMGGQVEEMHYTPLGEFTRIQITLSVILVIVYFLAGLYRHGRGTSLLNEMGTILGATSMGMMLTLALVYLYQGYAYSRAVFLFAWVLIAVLLSGARVGKRLALIYMRQRGIGIKRALVVGGDTLGKMVMHVIATEPRLGYQLVGFVQDNCEEDIGRFKYLGQPKDLHNIVHEYPIDEVIIALPSASHRDIPKIMGQCTRENLSFKIVPDLYEMSLSRVDVNDLRGIPLIGVKRVSIQGANLVMKRAFDSVLSLLFLILASPFWGLIALAIKLDSPGPVLFKQVRVGKGGRLFSTYKFRSMRISAEEEITDLIELNEATWPLFKIRDDPRVTRVGRWLRRTSLDELPQLLNVLRGEMSLVGPRPPIPSEVEKYETWHMKRLDAAPGITGLWQVSGRSELPFDEMVMLDIYYIENWSVGLDFTILLRTIPTVLSGRGAY